MVEHRPALTLLSHVVLILGVLIIAFPVYLTFVASTQAQGWAVLQVVDMQEMLGAARLLCGQVGGRPLILRVDATLLPPVPGRTVHVGTSAGHLHWFDPRTLQRVTNP